MKEINLLDYYPLYTTDTIVEVPAEVADLLHEYKRNEAAYIFRTYRHKAYFSLDYNANVERDILIVQPSPLKAEKRKNCSLPHMGGSREEKTKGHMLRMEAARCPQFVLYCLSPHSGPTPRKATLS